MAGWSWRCGINAEGREGCHGESGVDEGMARHELGRIVGCYLVNAERGGEEDEDIGAMEKTPLTWRGGVVRAVPCATLPYGRHDQYVVASFNHEDQLLWM